MGNSPRLRDSVVHAKQLLAEGRAKLREQHDSGSPGIQVSQKLTDLVDSTMLSIWQSAVADADANSEKLTQEVALVAHSGYGRRDLAPFSDVDLLLLHEPKVEKKVAELARRILSDGSDVGLNLGFSVRTPAVASQLARRNPIIFTAQSESRLLAGSEALLERFMRRYRRQTKRRWRYHLRRIEQARKDERTQYGETVFLLEPNIKRSRGGLRDIHLLRWAGFARYGKSDPSSLHLQGLLSNEDYRAIRDALEFLLRLRNEMHFHAGRAYDVLFRGEQQRIAELWAYEGTESVLPVERFMSEYFRHTSRVRQVVGHFCSSAEHRSFVNPLIAPLVSHRLDRDFRIGPIHIGTTRRGKELLTGNLTEVLRLMDLANQTGKRIEHGTWTAVRDDMSGRSEIEVTEETAQRFMSILSFPTRLGRLLRLMHEVGVLEKLIVGMDHARSLLQFNRYHKYTVDEHCIRAVERATDFQTDSGQLGAAYRSIKDRSMLHLALLVHDLGKGLPGDHSEVGAKLAVQTAIRLRLSKRKTQMLEYLVRKHLLMSHLAFRRDTSDESILVQFASEVGSPEYMKMLFVLTAADLAAVGPGVLNPWKIEILSEVYRRANFHLKGADVDSESVVIRTNDLRDQVLKHVPKEHLGWFKRQVDMMNTSFLMENESQAIVKDLDRLRTTPKGKAQAWGRYVAERRVSEYALGLHEDLTPGIFHRATGALTSQGLQILSASIHTLADGLVLDRFLVEDPDFDGAPSEERINSVSAAIVNALEHPSENRPVFRRLWQPSTSDPSVAMQHLPSRVVIDNTTLLDCTIIDVFAHDRTGLLYVIARTIYELNLSVKYAKIGTYLDQVVDVFYVTDLEGAKLKSDERLERIREELLAAIETTSHRAS